ncbi:MAG TPA: hypothetical protein DDX29_00705 [Clostridiales bacterium]|nr:hypothetical protein [Clostridiales bacterium]
MSFIKTFISIFLVFVSSAYSQEKTFDFISEISKNQSLSDEIGLKKLSKTERKKLNELLNNIFLFGVETGKKEFSGISNAPNPRKKAENKGKAKAPSSNIAYKTIIDSDDGDVLKLDNGAIVEISYGYLGYVGYRKDAVLYKSGHQWKIWIEGKKSYKCDLLKAPSYGSVYSVEELTITEIKGDGTILIMSDGSIYEVGSPYTINTSLWIGFNDALLLDGFELLNLDESDEIIEVTRIK